MQRSNLLLTRCFKFSIISPNIRRLPSINIPARELIKRTYANTTKYNIGPPLGPARRVVSLPTKVTEMKLRCKVYFRIFFHVTSFNDHCILFYTHFRYRV